jgi:hypothetical protein
MSNNSASTVHDYRRRRPGPSVGSAGHLEHGGTTTRAYPHDIPSICERSREVAFGDHANSRRVIRVLLA